MATPTRKLTDASAAALVGDNIATLVEAIDALHESLPFTSAPAVDASYTAPFVQEAPKDIPVPLEDTPDTVPSSAAPLVATTPKEVTPADDDAGVQAGLLSARAMHSPGPYQEAS